MIELLEKEVARGERMREFVREALEADAAIDAGELVYSGADVHAWLERLARNPRAKRPGPWRG